MESQNTSEVRALATSLPNEGYLEGTGRWGRRLTSTTARSTHCFLLCYYDLRSTPSPYKTISHWELRSRRFGNYGFSPRLAQAFLAVTSTNCTRHSGKTTFIFKDLTTASHVFIRRDTPKKTFDPPYEGTYKVIRRNDRNIDVDVWFTGHRSSGAGQVGLHRRLQRATPNRRQQHSATASIETRSWRSNGTAWKTRCISGSLTDQLLAIRLHHWKGGTVAAFSQIS